MIVLQLRRTCPVYNNTCLSDDNGAAATVHVTAGTAGIGFDSTQWRDVPWSIAKFADVFAYGRIHVQGANDLTWQLIEVDTGFVLDEFIIHSNHTFTFPR